MRRLPKPTLSAKAAFEACVQLRQNEVLRKQLLALATSIETAEQQYENAGRASEFWRIVPSTILNGADHKEVMKSLYSGTFARLGTNVRSTYYDVIRGLPEHGLCPICGEGTVSELDHYLPKAHYSVYTVTPVNLIPACKDCNKAKSDAVLKTADEQTLHPYYDDVTGATWLTAATIGNSSILEFEVSAPVGWPDVIVKRLKYHLKTFGLYGSYAVLAARRLVTIRWALTQCFSIGGADEVNRYLTTEAASRREVILNSWEIAGYEAWAKSDWFCRGGFKCL